MHAIALRKHERQCRLVLTVANQREPGCGVGELIVTGQGWGVTVAGDARLGPVGQVIQKKVGRGTGIRRALDRRTNR